MSNKIRNFFPWKKSPKNLGSSDNFQTKLPKENNRPIVENSPNLVTLPQSTKCTVSFWEHEMSRNILIPWNHNRVCNLVKGRQCDGAIFQKVQIVMYDKLSRKKWRSSEQTRT
jgi:hypothetical protein